MIVRNVGTLPHYYTVSQPTRPRYELLLNPNMASNFSVSGFALFHYNRHF
jgi:hypothetical protein